MDNNLKQTCAMKTFKPYTDNIVFIDTEFSSLDPYKGELLSIGIVKLDGDELYLELEHEGEVSEWVKENIMPQMTSEKVTRDEAKKRIAEFVGSKKPYLVSYVTPYDSLYLKKLFNVGDLAHNNDAFPFHWLPVDFGSILFSLGVRPEDFARNRKEFCGQFQDIDLDQYKQHNALDDAKLLREIYLKMVTVK